MSPPSAMNFSSKFTSKMYLRGVSDWELIIQKQKLENYYLTIKRINEIEFYNVEVTKWKDNGGIAL